MTSDKLQNLNTLSIDDARSAISSGAQTATALAESHYATITARDSLDSAGSKGINSFLALSRERALSQAAKIDAMASRGDELPALAGVPVAIKDVLAMQIVWG